VNCGPAPLLLTVLYGILGSSSAHGQTNTSAAYTFSTLAGHAGAGGTDGVGSDALFNGPEGIVADTNGNFFVADTYNHTIRKVTAAGVVTTIAGFPGVRGDADGTNSAARFSYPWDITLDRGGNLYVIDSLNTTVRKIAPLGTNWAVTTIAGYPSCYVTIDGVGSTARFYNAAAITADGTNLYVSDGGTIRMASPVGTNWIVTTIVGSTQTPGSDDGQGCLARIGFSQGIAVDPAGNILLADSQNSTIRRITGGGTNCADWSATNIAGLALHPGSLDGTNSDAEFIFPTGIAADLSGNFFVADSTTIRKISPVDANWVVRTIAGTPFNYGNADGTGTNAQFNGLHGVAADGAGNLYVADSDNNAIRTVTSAGIVNTLAGLPVSAGSSDGIGAAARFRGPTGLAVDRAGNIYIGDTGNGTVRKINSVGIVTTLAGLATNFGSADGVGSYARFSGPAAVALDTGGNVFVADAPSSTIRRITAAGVASTIAGPAQVSNPYGVAVDQNSNVYVVNSVSNSTILMITPSGTNWVPTTIAAVDGTNGAALFGTIYGIALDTNRNLYVADGQVIRMITPTISNWVVSTIASLPNDPRGIAVDASGNNIYTANALGTGADTLTRITRAGGGWSVSTIGGQPDTPGNADGAGNSAQFSNPQGVAVDSLGNLYVADTGNNVIRKGKFTAYTATNPAPYIPPQTNGKLSITLLPSEANGQWRFPWELAWRPNGQVASNLAVGTYPVEFRPLPGWLAIPPRLTDVVVSNGPTTTITNFYYPTVTPSSGSEVAGSLTVNLGSTPPIGAFWQFIGDTNQLPSGYTTNLLPGTYLIGFAGPFSGRGTPPNASVQVSAGRPTVVSVTYPLTASAPAGVLLPQPVPAVNIGDLADYPFGFNGQLQSDVGYGSGVAALQNVVLTAAHMVFDDQNLSYVSQAYWFLRKTGGFAPLPQSARAFYVLSGYAAQRTNDLAASFGVDQSSAASRNLDVAALYFHDAVAGAGGYGGYLPSDSAPNPWLTSTSLKMLAGYPVDGSLFGDASIVPGQMYQTDPQPYPLTLAPDPVSGQQEVYIAPWFLSYPGNSGGPLYVQFNGYYYPAGVYLGTLYNGATYSSVVRAIDSNVVNLIATAQADAGTGTNNTGGGVITILPSQVSTDNPGYVQFQLGPPAALRAGAAWRLVCNGCDTNYSTATNYTLAVASTNAISVEFLPIPGWNLPTNQTVQVQAGELVNPIPIALYTDPPPSLSYKRTEGLRLFGASALTYRIDYKTNLNPQLPWLPLATNTLTTNTMLINGTLPTPGRKFFRAVKPQ
jgi:sugar lactone lactonase YvrE